MIWIIFFFPKGWNQSYTGFLPSSFSFSVHWSIITDYKFSKSCVLLLPCSWCQWWKLDIIWANYSRSFPLLISLWRSNGFTFCLQNPMHAHRCVPRTTCEEWLLTASGGRSRCGKARQDSPHGARACSLLHRLHWLHSECETPLHSMRTSGWLLTHCNYLSGIPRCLTVQPAKSRRATAPQTSHRKLSVLSFPISTPTWMTLFNITPQQSIGKKGWKGWFLFIRKTTIGRGGNGFFF